MANISIKSQKITLFGGIFHVMEKFDRYIGQVIDGEWEGLTDDGDVAFLLVQGL